jgi:hypothetical protein
MNSLFRTVLLVFAAAALALAGRAGAANVVTNPGFEAGCGGMPCNWSVTGASVQAHSDSTTANSGSVSIATSIGVSHTGLVSDCIDGVAGANASASFAYETNDAATAGLEYSTTYYDGANCSGFALGGDSLQAVAAVGGWHTVAGTLTVPPGTVSAKIFLTRSCAVQCADFAAVNFDDVSFAPAGTTAATIRSFTATRSPAGTLLRWRTASELEVAGFNVYRVEHGRHVKVNRRLLAARARAGATYRLLDRGHRGARYRLEIVNLDGTRQWRNAA